MSTTTDHRRRTIRHDAHDVRNAWLSLLLLPVAFYAGFMAANGVMSSMGYTGDVRVPPGPAALAALPAVLIVALPALTASWFAARAARRGDRSGWLPAGLLIAVAVLFALQNLAAYVFSW